MANLNGIICICKPKDFSSFDVVAKMRGITKTKKIGHAGTLDPMATGVLPLFLGNATRACDRMPDGSKTYLASFQLGVTTDTYDRWGKVLSQTKADCTRAQLEQALEKFRGTIDQMPPMYSAVQINGQRLYDLARQGKTVARPTRQVEIRLLRLCHFDPTTQTGQLEVDCSKGTYIRSLCHDLGEELGCGCMMTELVRTRAGIFTLNDCITLEQAQAYSDQGELSSLLLPVERVFSTLPSIRLNPIQSRKFQNGLRLDLNRVIHQTVEGSHTVFDQNGIFLGLATLDLEKMELVIEKMFAERESST